ncbi:hypothetical protein DB88DRAFT_502478 [Papiliotrema laurentii]|uniref:Uncharacterized protein n=1 Tax=Papiliotrema laurentii TaxID=5418 RepID=A0AAD9FIK7_PAPLA|nr:hypothetical protein DB88DRAFT_502753 [Papiliotrema laurentii]KAK1920686.1 hypothetical protein DB88DRAFT_502949 [Papiliotrema laurentii]KAK1920710.1 hypothetical protein DB88DRAFT_502478 [Papiliotrema laurentii]
MNETHYALSAAFGGATIPVTIIIGSGGIGWWLLRNPAKRRPDMTKVIQRIVTILTIAMWFTNIAWTRFIYRYHLFKKGFAELNRHWPVAIALHLITSCLPLLVIPIYFLQRTKPKLAEIVANLIPRLITTCSALNSLEAFWNHPSPGWLDEKAAFARGMYAVFVLTSTAGSLVSTCLQQPRRQSPQVLSERRSAEPVPENHQGEGPVHHELRDIEAGSAMVIDGQRGGGSDSTFPHTAAETTSTPGTGSASTSNFSEPRREDLEHETPREAGTEFNERSDDGVDSFAMFLTDPMITVIFGRATLAAVLQLITFP